MVYTRDPEGSAVAVPLATLGRRLRPQFVCLRSHSNLPCAASPSCCSHTSRSCQCFSTISCLHQGGKLNRIPPGALPESYSGKILCMFEPTLCPASCWLLRCSKTGACQIEFLMVPMGKLSQGHLLISEDRVHTFHTCAVFSSPASSVHVTDNTNADIQQISIMRNDS